MRTDDLIANLTSDLKPVRRGGLELLLGAGLVAGAVVTAGMMAMWLGVRPDLHTAMRGFAFWMKAIYTLALTVVGFLLVERAGRPGSRLLPTALLALLALAIIWVIGVMQMMHAPAADKPSLFFGASYTVCPRNILVLSLPILVGVVLAMRRMAPTRPALAGAAAGLLAGSGGASVYGLHCPEASAMFVAVWYSLGIALAGAVGAVSGKLLLRW